MKRFKRAYQAQSLSVPEMVEDAVYMDTYDRGGELEVLKAEVAFLTKLVGFMASKLSEADQAEMAKWLGYVEADR